MKIHVNSFEKLYKKGYIEEKTIKQMYCNTCQMFVADRFLKGGCYHKDCKGIANGDQCDVCQNMIDVEKLINPFCTICKSRPELKDTSHLYLKLGEFESFLKTFFKKFARNVFKNTHVFITIFSFKPRGRRLKNYA